MSLPESVTIRCDHDGGRRSRRDPADLDWWDRDTADTWSSQWIENTGVVSAEAAHQIVLNAYGDRDDPAHHLVGPDGQHRLRGGVTRNRRGYTFTCPLCGIERRVRYLALCAVLEARRARGDHAVDLSSFDNTRSQPDGRPSDVR